MSWDTPVSSRAARDFGREFDAFSRGGSSYSAPRRASAPSAARGGGGAAPAGDESANDTFYLGVGAADSPSLTPSGSGARQDIVAERAASMMQSIEAQRVLAKARARARPRSSAATGARAIARRA